MALSRGSPRVGVTHHLALWSPDFPRRSRAAVTRPTHPPDSLEPGRRGRLRIESKQGQLTTEPTFVPFADVRTSAKPTSLGPVQADPPRAVFKVGYARPWAFSHSDATAEASFLSTTTLVTNPANVSVSSFAETAFSAPLTVSDAFALVITGMTF